jgi:hypothetical protein
MTALASEQEALLAPSRTARTMRLLRRALIVGALILGVLCEVGLAGAHGALDSVKVSGAPAAVQAREAADALAEAEQAAVTAIGSGASAVAGLGLGDEYDNDVALVDQSLTELAGDNAAGTAGLTQIDLIEATTVTYNNQVHQAYSDYQQGSGGLAYPDLAQATTLAATLSGELGTLAKSEDTALTAQRSSGWLSSAADWLWLAPGVLVLALILATWRLILVRFRRRMSVPLALGTLCVLGTLLVCGLSLQAAESDERTAVASPHASTIRLYDQLAATATTDANNAMTGQTGQPPLTPATCPVVYRAGLCGDQLSPRSAHTSAAAAAPSASTLREISDDAARYQAGLAASTSGYAVRVGLIAVLAVAAALLAAFGLNTRIDEYTFRG